MTDPIIDELFAVIQDRQETLPEDSYTASLLEPENAENLILEKLGEEVTELILSTKDDDHEAIAHEGADLIYHLLVLLAAKDMTVDDLRTELRTRR